MNFLHASDFHLGYARYGLLVRFRDYARAFRGDLSANFREAVKNWKDLDAEARGKYIFVLPEDEREKVLTDEFYLIR